MAKEWKKVIQTLANRPESSLKEVASYLGVSPRTVNGWLKSNRPIPVVHKVQLAAMSKTDLTLEDLLFADTVAAFVEWDKNYQSLMKRLK